MGALLLILMAAAPHALAQVALSGVVAISSGDEHSCALSAGGGVKCWGSNTFGQLGDGTTMSRLTPGDVDGLGGAVTAIAAATSHTCALTSGGGVKCWGANFSGQLGDNTTTARPLPVDVVGLASGVSAIAAGDSHSCALTIAGGVKCWGGNSAGRLGDGTTTTRLTPIDVVGLTSGVVAIAVGAAHSCALTAGGAVKCWGLNFGGQLGNNSTSDAPTPVDVTGLGSGVSAIDAGFLHSCAVMVSGGLKCWGSNGAGQLGDGSITDRPVAVDVAGLTSGVVAVSTGSLHSCAVITGGAVKCWGGNFSGQVGDASIASRPTAVDVVGLTSGVTAIAAGSGFTCAITAGGGVACWGNNRSGQLGDNSTSQPLTAVNVIGLGGSASALAAGEHSCALTAAGGVACWGRNSSGQLGDGSDISRVAPVDVVGLGSGVAAISVGGDHSCALTAGGGVKCWGNNAEGQLGDGSQTGRRTPVDVVGLASGVVAISAGRFHTCALTASGGLRCWGQNVRGQLGDGSTTRRLTPVDVVGLTSGVSALSQGSLGLHSCAITSSGGAKCWGFNEQGQLGNNSTTASPTPVDVAGLSSGVAAMSLGLFHACAVTTGGTARCWGRNDTGQLGDNSQTPSLVPVEVVGLASPVVAIGVGRGHSCALSNAGGVRCWGLNAQGQLGDTTTLNRLNPVDVATLTGGVSAIAIGGDHACALTAGGVKCWGEGTSGELGHGQITQGSITPVTVVVLAAPGAPVIGSATAGDAAVSVAFSAPANNGGSTISGYTAVSTPGGFSSSGCTASPCTVSGLTNGTAYTFTVTATNALGTSAPSAASAPVTPQAGQSITFATAPTVTVGGTGTLSASGGGSGNPVVFTSQTPAVCTVSGSNGSTVSGVSAGTCTIAANQAGNANFTAAPQVTQTFTVSARPQFTVGGSIAGYQGSGLRLQLNGGADLNLAAGTTQFVFPAIDDGSPFAVTVVAQPAEPRQACTVDGGTGTLAGAAVSTVLVSCQTTAQVPAAPLTVQLAFAGGSATVSWTAPADDGGWAVSGYRVTLEPGGLGCEVSGTPPPTRCQIAGIRPGVTYTASVAARNGIGLGAAATATGSAATPPPEVIPVDRPWALLLLVALVALGARRSAAWRLR